MVSNEQGEAWTADGGEALTCCCFSYECANHQLLALTSAHPTLLTAVNYLYEPHTCIVPLAEEQPPTKMEPMTTMECFALLVPVWIQR